MAPAWLVEKGLEFHKASSMQEKLMELLTSFLEMEKKTRLRC